MMAVLEAEHKPAAPGVMLEEVLDRPEASTLDDLKRFVQSFPDLRVELTKEGELVIMPPTFRRTGRRNAKLSARLEVWSEATGLGETFDSSTLFLMPDESVLSPDASWVEKSLWDGLSEEDQDELTVLRPDFVAELRSKTDRLSAVQRKMRGFMETGARLGWLIDPKSRRVEIYRPGRDVEVLDAPETLSGEDVLPGFVLDLRGILD